MKEYQLTCQCGEIVPVRAGQAEGRLYAVSAVIALRYLNLANYQGFHWLKNMMLVVNQRGIARRALFFLALWAVLYL